MISTWLGKTDKKSLTKGLTRLTINVQKSYQRKYDDTIISIWLTQLHTINWLDNDYVHHQWGILHAHENHISTKSETENVIYVRQATATTDNAASNDHDYVIHDDVNVISVSPKLYALKTTL